MDLYIFIGQSVASLILLALLYKSERNYSKIIRENWILKRDLSLEKIAKHDAIIESKINEIDKLDYAATIDKYELKEKKGVYIEFDKIIDFEYRLTNKTARLEIIADSEIINKITKGELT